MGRYHHFAIVCILKMNRNVYFFEFTGWYLVSSVGLGNSYMFEQVRVVNSIRMLLSPSSRQYNNRNIRNPLSWSCMFCPTKRNLADADIIIIISTRLLLHDFVIPHSMIQVPLISALYLNTQTPFNQEAYTLEIFIKGRTTHPIFSRVQTGTGGK